MKLTIKVTEDDIQNGTREETDCCAIAVAYKRQTGRACHVRLCPEATLCDEGGERYDLPKAAVNFAEDFDYARKVEPFSFDIETCAKCAEETQ